MSRYQKYINSLTGISNFIQAQGIKRTDTDKLVNEYSKLNSLKGSYSDRILMITDNFKPFREFINTKK